MRRSIIWLGLALVISLLAIATPAEASTGGCPGKVSEWAFSRVAQKEYRYHAGRLGLQTNQLRFVTTPLLFRCDTRFDRHHHVVPGPERYKQFLTTGCWTNSGGRMEWDKFQGFRYQGRMRDSFGHVTQSPGGVPSQRGAYQNCTDIAVPDAEQAWFPTEHNLILYSVPFSLRLKRPMDDQNGIMLSHPVHESDMHMVAEPHYLQPGVSGTVTRKAPPVLCSIGQPGHRTMPFGRNRYADGWIQWNNCHQGRRHFLDPATARLDVNMKNGTSVFCNPVMGHWQSTSLRIKIVNYGRGVETGWSNWHKVNCSPHGGSTQWSLSSYPNMVWRGTQPIGYKMEMKDDYYLAPARTVTGLDGTFVP